MNSPLSKYIVFLKLALENNIIESDYVIKWADDEISSKDIALQDNFKVDLSLENNKCRLLEVLNDEIYKRGLGNQKVEGKMFLDLFKKQNPVSQEDVLKTISRLLWLSHNVSFTKEKIEKIYLVDEYGDEYLDGIISFETVKETLYDLLKD